MKKKFDLLTSVDYSMISWFAREIIMFTCSVLKMSVARVTKGQPLPVNLSRRSLQSMPFAAHNQGLLIFTSSFTKSEKSCLKEDFCAIAS